MSEPDTHYLRAQAGRIDRRQVAESWQTFISGQSAYPSGVDLGIVDSWQRCKTLGVDPKSQSAALVGAGREFDDLAHRNAEIIDAAKHTWDVLSESILASDSIFIVTDERGVILDVRGNSELVGAAAKAHVAPGYDWSESSAGTNAIGTALAEAKPIIIRSDEHYCKNAKIWDCAAAPVHDLNDGSVLGVLDITSVGDLSDHHTLALAVTAAKQIEHTVHAREMARSVQLLNWYRGSASRWRNQSTLLLDAKGRVITASDPTLLERDLRFDPSELDSRTAKPFAEFGIAITRTVAYPWPVFDGGGGRQAWQGGVAVIRSISDTGPTAGPSRRVTQDESDIPPAFRSIITTSAPFVRLIETAAKMARANAPVLLIGETGSGKELFARGIHQSSTVASGPFVAVNCGTLTAELAGSELFGYEAGAFTGASRRGRVGKFQQADGGTLFLDEVGELPLDVQVQLLRVLQENVVIKVGGNDEHPVNVRIIAATNRELDEEVGLGRFRQDLFFRLNSLSLRLMPLRDRIDDLDRLVEAFLIRMQGLYGLGTKTVAPELLQELKTYAWPGNVRELYSVVESMYVLSSGGILNHVDLPADFSTRLHPRTAGQTSTNDREGLEAAEHAAIISALDENPRNVSAAARQLGISRSTLYRKIKRYGITVP